MEIQTNCCYATAFNQGAFDIKKKTAKAGRSCDKLPPNKSNILSFHGSRMPIVFKFLKQRLKGQSTDLLASALLQSRPSSPLAHVTDSIEFSPRISPTRLNAPGSATVVGI
ncbi:Protein of unknown function [Cotesia congregata]|uniref:Uncharacterized protein n=1 Tax=Cotesia congregata TaxID=51543 RepID=A0A8J2MPP4_COTCN|nr:Protein of unknown function [Cotesia congregata]